MKKSENQLNYEAQEIDSLGEWSSYRIKISSGEYDTKWLLATPEQLKRIKAILAEEA